MDRQREGKNEDSLCENAGANLKDEEHQVRGYLFFDKNFLRTEYDFRHQNDFFILILSLLQNCNSWLQAIFPLVLVEHEITSVFLFLLLFAPKHIHSFILIVGKEGQSIGMEFSTLHPVLIMNLSS